MLHDVETKMVSDMKAIHGDRELRSYGSTRMREELASRGHRVSENTVVKLMRAYWPYLAI